MNDIATSIITHSDIMDRRYVHQLSYQSAVNPIKSYFFVVKSPAILCYVDDEVLVCGLHQARCPWSMTAEGWQRLWQAKPNNRGFANTG